MSVHPHARRCPQCASLICRTCLALVDMLMGGEGTGSGRRSRQTKKRTANSEKNKRKAPLRVKEDSTEGLHTYKESVWMSVSFSCPSRSAELSVFKTAPEKRGKKKNREKGKGKSSSQQTDRQRRPPTLTSLATATALAHSHPHSPPPLAAPVPPLHSDAADAEVSSCRSRAARRPPPLPRQDEPRTSGADDDSGGDSQLQSGELHELRRLDGSWADGCSARTRAAAGGGWSVCVCAAAAFPSAAASLPLVARRLNDGSEREARRAMRPECSSEMQCANDFSRGAAPSPVESRAPPIVRS